VAALTLLKKGLKIDEGVHFEVISGNRGNVEFQANHEDGDIQYKYKVVSIDQREITETKLETSFFKNLWRSIFSN
jgi:hypothetical protein